MDDKITSTLPPGATPIPNAGRPADSPGVITEQAAKAAEPPKRDQASAKELPDLYKSLEGAKALVHRLETSAAQFVNVHLVQANIGGEEHSHYPFDKAAWAKFLYDDAKARVEALRDKIKSLGFEPH